MNFLVIYCHSNPKSYTYAVFNNIFEGLAVNTANSIDVIDLYKEGFDPVLWVDENKRRRDMHKEEATAAYRALIQKADHLIFVYPIWWQGLPAILKGFIDRVFATEFAYTFKNKKDKAILPEGLMRGKRVTCFYTLDAPYWVALLDPSWLGIKYGIFRYCGFSPVKRFFLANLKQSDAQTRIAWLEKCKKNAFILGGKSII